MKPQTQTRFLPFLGIIVVFLGVSLDSSIVSSNAITLTAPDNNDDNLPNNLQPFPPEENDGGLYIRALLCPDIPPEALPYFRFHLVSRLCYEVGTQGPCGKNMIFVKEPLTKAIGKCICMSSDNNHRPLIRDPQTNQCFYVYTQAFCPDGEWLVLNQYNHNHIECEENPCAGYEDLEILDDYFYNQSSNSNETSNSTSTSIAIVNNVELRPQQYVFYNGTCSQLDSTSEHCQENQILTFSNGELNCVYNTTFTSSVQNLASNNDEENQINFEET